MGQAKRRGTYEERKAIAVEASKVRIDEMRKLLSMRLDEYSPEERRGLENRLNSYIRSCKITDHFRKKRPAV